MFVSFKITVTVINSVFKGRFWFSLVGDASPFHLEEPSPTFGLTTQTMVSPGYNVVTPFLAKVRERVFSLEETTNTIPRVLGCLV